MALVGIVVEELLVWTSVGTNLEAERQIGRDGRRKVPQREHRFGGGEAYRRRWKV